MRDVLPTGVAPLECADPVERSGLEYDVRPRKQAIQHSVEFRVARHLEDALTGVPVEPIGHGRGAHPLETDDVSTHPDEQPPG